MTMVPWKVPIRTIILILWSWCTVAEGGSLSLSSTVSQVVSANYGGLMGRNRLYRIRYDKEANDDIPGSVFDLQDVQDGIFRLPPVPIRRVAYYYSQFFTDDDEEEASHHALDSHDNWEIDFRAPIDGQRHMNQPEIHSESPVQPSKEKELVASDDWNLFAHVYVIIETQDGTYHSIEKFEDYIDFRSSKDPSSVLKYQWGATGRMERSNAHFAQRQGWQKPFVAHAKESDTGVPQEGNTRNNTSLFLNEIVPFLETELQNPYHVTNDNCKHFVKRFQRHFMSNPCQTTYPTHHTCPLLA